MAENKDYGSVGVGVYNLSAELDESMREKWRGTEYLQFVQAVDRIIHSTIFFLYHRHSRPTERGPNNERRALERYNYQIPRRKECILYISIILVLLI